MVTCVIHLHHLIRKVSNENAAYLTNLVVKFKDTKIELNNDDKLKVEQIFTHLHNHDGRSFSLINLSTKTDELNNKEQTVTFEFKIELMQVKGLL